MKPCHLFAVIFPILILSSCSVLKKEDTSQEIRDFLLAFQNTLNQRDNETILRQFDTQQSREVLLSAISVLKNQEHEFIVCEPAYGMAEIIIGENTLQVIIPVTFRSQKLEEEFRKTTSITLWLKPKKKSYVISKLEAEEFYRSFAGMKSQMEWQVERKHELDQREPLYRITRSLENSFDSVIWFTRYGEKHYFYVVSGDWVNWFANYDARRPSMDTRMGLVTESGEVIVPLEYDQVGTIGFDFTNVVEVEKEGKVGYFDLGRRSLIVPVSYDLIIPYKKNGAQCIVKTDSVYGWYTNDYQYRAGFPDQEAERWVMDFKFIPANLHIDSENYSLSEIPDQDQAGNGIVVMPSYLAKTGVFRDIVAGISPTDFPLNGYTDYVETKASFVQQISESISGLVTTIRERYLDGREEFYTHNNLVLVGRGQDTLAVARLYSGGDVSFNVLDSILEVKSLPGEGYYGGDWEENMPLYYYFKLGEGTAVEKLSSRRNFPMTEYVMLDSSYLSGDFSYYNFETETTEKITFLSLTTITYMRNEILASYGVKFVSKEGYKEFGQFEDLPERSREDVTEILSEVDSHNIRFLDRMIELMEPKNVI